MGLFRRRSDSELWPGTELWVLFPDKTLRVDKNPRVEGQLIVSDKFELVCRLTTPLRLCEWRRSKELGAQPIPTDKYVWVMTGDTAEIPNDEEFQEALELAYLRASRRALEKSNRRRSLYWQVAIASLASAALLRFANIFDVVHGWNWW